MICKMMCNMMCNNAKSQSGEIRRHVCICGYTSARLIRIINTHMIGIKGKGIEGRPKEAELIHNRNKQHQQHIATAR